MCHWSVVVGSLHARSSDSTDFLRLLRRMGQYSWTRKMVPPVAALREIVVVSLAIYHDLCNKVVGGSKRQKSDEGEETDGQLRNTQSQTNLKNGMARATKL